MSCLLLSFSTSIFRLPGLSSDFTFHHCCKLSFSLDFFSSCSPLTSLLILLFLHSQWQIKAQSRTSSHRLVWKTLRITKTALTEKKSKETLRSYEVWLLSDFKAMRLVS
jgi:hypothetical protein